MRLHFRLGRGRRDPKAEAIADILSEYLVGNVSRFSCKFFDEFDVNPVRNIREERDSSCRQAGLDPEAHFRGRDLH
jgi:hypothetical protein